MFAYLDDLLRNQKSFSKDQVTNKNSPLIFNVIADDNKEVFDYYIKNYSEYININDAKGNSPIFQLLYTKINTEYFLTELLKFNLDLNAKDEFGKNLKFHAKKMKNKELLEIINEIN